MDKKTYKRILDALTAIVGKEQVHHDSADTWSYGYDNSRRHAVADFVVFPDDAEQIQKIVRLCNEHHVAIIARGRGTGTTGATVPTQGGIILSMEHMDKILDIDRSNRIMVVQPGVTNQAVQQAAAEYGFFWPPDPTSAAFCTIGGNLAYNSAGPRAVKYGTPRENTLGLKAVTGQGEFLRCGVYTSKGVVGYDLTRLIIGSEGTLAIITEATLKLTPLPADKRTIKAVYQTIDNAAQAVADIMAQDTTPCSLEFMDKNALDMVRDYSDAELPEQAGAMLMIEVDGNTECLETLCEKVKTAASNDGLIELHTATTKAEVDALWATRKALSPSLRNIAPKKINEDVVVPVSNIPALIRGLDELSQEYGIAIVNFGHAGNGNIHVNLLVHPEQPGQLENAHACLLAVFDLVLKLNGTLSGEHGVGLEKRDYIASELDPEALRLMQAIKKQFDPNHILNPGKTLPDDL